MLEEAAGETYGSPKTKWEAAAQEQIRAGASFENPELPAVAPGESSNPLDEEIDRKKRNAKLRRKKRSVKQTAIVDEKASPKIDEKLKIDDANVNEISMEIDEDMLKSFDDTMDSITRSITSDMKSNGINTKPYRTKNNENFFIKEHKGAFFLAMGLTAKYTYQKQTCVGDFFYRVIS